MREGGGGRRAYFCGARGIEGSTRTVVGGGGDERERWASRGERTSAARAGAGDRRGYALGY